MKHDTRILIILLTFNVLIINNISAQVSSDLRPLQQLTELFENVDPKDHSQKLACLLPLENQVVFYKNVYIMWDNPNGNVSRFQVAEDFDFQMVIIDTVLSTNSWTIPALEKHREYHWRVFNESSHEVRHHAQSFFKTSSIQLDEYYDQNTIEFIPTWIGNKEILFVSNPEKIDCKIKIFDEKETMISQKCVSQDKFAFRTEAWPRGMYKLILSFPDDSSHTKYFVLK